MRFTHKVYVLLAATALPPVALLGWVAVRVAGHAIESRVVEHEKRAAAQAADAIERTLDNFARDLGRASAHLPFERVPLAAMGQVLRVPYQHLGWATTVALLDEAGHTLAPPARRAPGDRSPADRATVHAADLEIFGRKVRLQDTLSTGATVGPTYLSSNGEPRLVLARAFAVTGGRRWVLAAEASLADVQAILSDLAPSGAGAAYLVNAKGTLVTHPRAAWVVEGRTMEARAPIRDGLARRATLAGRYTDLANVEVFGAFAPVASIAGGVVVEQPAAEAFAALDELARAALIWTLVALALAGFGAVILARAFAAPIRALCSAAAAIGRGEFGPRLQVRTRDELGELAEAFNRMADEVQSKQDEITAWNRDLTRRVDERTQELNDARDQILQSEKLAATAGLAAGVAHELNNPLTTIMGLGQVLVETSTNGVREDLQEIVDQAERMRTIVANLARFARPNQGRDGQTIDLNRVLEEAVSINREKLESRGVHAEMDLTAPPPLIEGSPPDLLLVALHLVSNALHAMPRGGTLRLQTHAVARAAVKVVVADTGVGIPPERVSRIFEPFYTDRTAGPERGSGGLGLSVTHRIVGEHHGRISVSSQVGEGTTFTLLFPGRRQELHLR